MTEARAGVYAFGDLVQAELGTCAIDDIAIGVLASVIGHNRQHGRVLIDAGFLALSRDRGTADMPVDWGYGAVCDAVSGEVDRRCHCLLDQPGTWHHHQPARRRSTSSAFRSAAACAFCPITPVRRRRLTIAIIVTDGSERILDVWERVNGW